MSYEKLSWIRLQDESVSRWMKYLDKYLARIATKVSDVVSHPFQRQYLVHQPIIAGPTVRGGFAQHVQR